MSDALLITGIKQLLTFDGPQSPRSGALMNDVGLVTDAAVLVSGGRIIAAGKRKVVEAHPRAAAARALKADGVVLPGFCDSHTHPVFAAPRITDFLLRNRGASYAEIKEKGGGIISSITGVRDASAYELEKLVRRRAERFLECGTTSIEAKSGYGLSADAEIKSLKAIAKAAKESPLTLVPTALAAHGVPPEFPNAERYAEYVMAEILPQIAAQRLAVFSDVFCEKGYFSMELSERLLNEGARLGLRPKIHAEQLHHFGGAEVAAKTKAVSADHIDCVDERDIELMRCAGVIGTLLPASNYFLGISKYPPARKMIDGGLCVALATDFNPGTSPCWNMQFVISLACTQMKMTPEEALCAATVNGAYAMGLGGKAGVIAEGMPADLAIMRADDYREIAYYFGDNLCSAVIKKGKIVFNR